MPPLAEQLRPIAASGRILAEQVQHRDVPAALDLDSGQALYGNILVLGPLGVADGVVRLRSFKGKSNAKYDHSHQEVYVHADLLTDLLSFIDGRPDDAPLFISALRRTRLSIRGVQRVIGDAAKRAGIRHVHPHMLRHTFITNLMENEVPLHTAQGLSRHRSAANLLRYAHPSTRSKMAASAAVGV